MKKNLFVIAIIICLICTIGLTGCRNKLSQREQKCFELIRDCSFEFKNPKSVRVLSGTLTYYTDLYEEGDEYIAAYVVLTSKNLLGTESASNYFIGYKDDGTAFCFDLDYFGEDSLNYSESVKNAE